MWRQLKTEMYILFVKYLPQQVRKITNLKFHFYVFFCLKPVEKKN